MALHFSCFTYPNWEIYGPQPGLNLAKVLPHSILPGYYSNNRAIKWGTLTPTLPSMYLNSKYMSTDQLNYVVSYIAYSYLFDKKLFLVDNSNLEIMYDQLYTYCRLVLAEISEWHVLFCKYRNGDTSDREMQVIRMLRALDNYWDELRIEHGWNLYNNYKLYHSEYKINKWKHHGSVSDRFYIKNTMEIIQEKRYPICNPPWKELSD